MQLSFLGQPYEASFSAIEAVETTKSATFLGQRYLKKQFNVSQRQPTAALTYRGVPYQR